MVPINMSVDWGRGTCVRSRGGRPSAEHSNYDDAREGQQYPEDVLPLILGVSQAANCHREAGQQDTEEPHRAKRGTAVCEWGGDGIDACTHQCGEQSPPPELGAAGAAAKVRVLAGHCTDGLDEGHGEFFRTQSRRRTMRARRARWRCGMSP